MAWHGMACVFTLNFSLLRPLIMFTSGSIIVGQNNMKGNHDELNQLNWNAQINVDEI